MKKALGVFGILILIALIFTLVSATNIQKGAWDTGKATTSSHGVGGNEFDTLLIIVDEDTTIATTDTSAIGHSISIWQTSDSSNLNFGAFCNYVNSNCIFSGIFAGECDTITEATQHGVIVGGLVNLLYDANKSFIGSGKHNTIWKASMCAIIGGEADTIGVVGEVPTGHYSGIVAGYGNIIKDQYCFIGAGDSNYIEGSSRSSIVGGDHDTILGGGRNVILSGGNNKISSSNYSTILGGINNYINSLGNVGVTIVGGGEDTIYRSDYASIIGGRYNYINEGDYSIINGGSSNYIEGQYSTIFSGKACSTWTKYATAMGFESKVYGAIDDSINFAGGVGGICDSTMGSFAWNCKVKLADSTFGICKQIWVMLGVDTTIITSTSVRSHTWDGNFWIQGDTTFYTDGGADTNWVINDGTYLKFGGDNTIYFDKIVTFNGQTSFTSSIILSADGAPSYIQLNGERIFIDYNNNDDLAMIIFHSEDSVVVDTSDHILRWTGSGGIKTDHITCVKSDTIASAATLTLTNYNNFVVTGTVDIDSLDTDGAIANWKVFYIEFTGIAAANGLVDGKNVHIAGNFAYNSDDIVVLQRRGDIFYEISRSAN